MPTIKMPNGDLVAFPDDMPEVQIRGMIAQKFPREVAQATLGMPSADREQPSAAASAAPMPGLGSVGTFAAAGPEGVPILGGLLDKGAMAASAGLGSLISGDPYSKVHSEMEGMKARGNEEHPWARLAGNVAGGTAALAPIGATELGASALGMRGGSLAEKALYSSLSGGGINMADTLARGGSGEDALKSGAIGLGLGGLAPVVGSAIGGVASKLGNAAESVAGTFNPKIPRVTPDELKAAGNAAYDAADKAGVIINGNGMKQLVTNIQQDLADNAYLKASQPGVRNVLNEIVRQSKLNNGNITLKGLDAIRSMAGDAWMPQNPKNNMLLGKIVDHIDGLINSKDPNLMAGVNTGAGVDALNQARKTWAQFRKLDTVEKFAKKGEAIGLAQINQDVPGATRRQVKQLLVNDAKARGFTPEEMAAAKRAARMTPGMNAARYISGLAPGHGRMSGMLHGAGFLHTIPQAFMGNPAPLALQIGGMGVGHLAQRVEEGLSRRAFDKFADVVAKRPVYKNSAQKAIASAQPALQQIPQAMQIPLLAALLQAAR